MIQASCFELRDSSCTSGSPRLRVSAVNRRFERPLATLLNSRAPGIHRIETMTMRTMMTALGATVLLTACGNKDGRSDYVKDGDTGAASPATVTTPNNP